MYVICIGGVPFNSTYTHIGICIGICGRPILELCYQYILSRFYKTNWV